MRAKAAPMVRGLFPAREREPVLALLERSVVFLTPENIETVLRNEPWLGTAWDLASLYLGSVGAEPLGEDAPCIVGLSQGTTCYVSARYFSEEDPFADFVVHEAAHVFHNCKRSTVGLTVTRRREWLLEIDFHKREAFAYACEALSRILESARGPGARKKRLAELEEASLPTDDRVDRSEYLHILHEAVASRNGWKRVLELCSPIPVRPRVAGAGS